MKADLYICTLRLQSEHIVCLCIPWWTAVVRKWRSGGLHWVERPVLLTLVVVSWNSWAVAVGCYLKRLNSWVVIFLTRPNCPSGFPPCDVSLTLHRLNRLARDRVTPTKLVIYLTESMIIVDAPLLRCRLCMKLAACRAGLDQCKTILAAFHLYWFCKYLIQSYLVTNLGVFYWKVGGGWGWGEEKESEYV